jgi:hypothetical protein
MALHNRLVSFANASIDVRYTDALGERIVDLLFQHIPGDPAVPAHTTFRLIPGVDDDELTLYRENKLLYMGTHAGDAANALLSQACYHLANVSHGGMVLHAGAVAGHGKGILLPACSGSGKTTLTAWLLTQGFSFLTDELVFIAEGSRDCQGFGRPLNVKHGSVDVVRSLCAVAPEGDQRWETSQGELIAPDHLSSAAVQHDHTVDLILFPQFKHGAEPSLERLSKARAALSLVECLINARNLTTHGMSEAARLARAVPAYKLVYSEFAQIDGLVEDLLQDPPLAAGH